jgi:hypothetical protein
MMIGIYASLKKLDKKEKSKSISEMSKERYSCKKKRKQVNDSNILQDICQTAKKKILRLTSQWYL